MEPSGIVYHPTRHTLFIVGDGGEIVECDSAGTVLQSTQIENMDLEGLTTTDSGSALYAAVESTDQILELSPQDLSVLRTFSIPRTYEGTTILPESGPGIEGITFVPQASHPEGGTFWVSNQGRTSGEAAEAALLLEVSLPLTSLDDTTPVSILSTQNPSISDLSGLVYRPDNHDICVLSDKMNQLQCISLTGTTSDTYSIPGVNQEGIAIDRDNGIWIADDTGSISYFEAL